MNKLIQKFNNSQTRLVISDWPEKTKDGEKNYGIAWYTKELLEPLAKEHNMRFVVLGEKGMNDKPQLAADGRILVLRTFDQKHPTLFPRILHWLLTFNKIKYVDIHSEFCTNGGIKNFLLLLPFIALIKLAGKHITYFSHNVVTDINSIAPHLGLKKNSFYVRTLKVGIQTFYRILGLILDRFVVMDEAIYKRLALFVNPVKIYLNPFWIESKKTVSKSTARRKLAVPQEDFVLLYFGFITYYKGADWVIKTVKELQKSRKFAYVNLILAGGEAYSLKDKAHYKEFYQKLSVSTGGQAKIRITGFVPEDKIGTYFSASDLVVLPYRGLIGSSATLSQALAYKKPFIVSSAMGEVLKNKDTAQALVENNVSKNEISFEHNTNSFARILSLTQDKNVLQKLTNVSKSLGEMRNKQELLESCYNKLYAPYKKVSPIQTPALAQSS